MKTRSTDYDVIIVGGRVAGSALAARLGLYGLRVLLLERDTLPSLPAVSSPIIYASTMRMLDEIGADETAYARNTPRIYKLANVLADGYVGKIRLPEYKGRDYAYAIDRARFDAALWDTAVQLDEVDGLQGFSVTDLTRDGERVTGITGKTQDGESRTYSADVVIGADGRFGLVARKTGAQKRDEHTAHPTSIYYAYWEGVRPLDDEGPSAAAYEGEDNAYGYLVMDSADDQAVIAIEGRSDVIDPPAGDAEGYYLRLLKRSPLIWRRVVGAERVTTVRGMRNVGNCYREPGGPGWALVGDAYHQKDPLDGQGIYNAVVTGKALAQEIRRWKQGEITWEEALANYDETARIKTYPMYRALQGRVRGSFYSDVSLPTWATRTLGRWLMQDPNMNRLIGQMLTRQIPPDMVNLLSPPVMLGALAAGPLRDLRRQLEERLR